MSKRRRDGEITVHKSFDGDHMVTPEGYKVLTLSYYIRIARAAMEERDFWNAWNALGSAIALSNDTAEIRDLKQLEKKAYKHVLNRKPSKAERKKLAEKRGKRREYA